MSIRIMGLVGGPTPGKRTIHLDDGDDIPREVTVKIAEGPRQQGEESPRSMPGVTTFAFYRFAEIGSDDVLVYAYSNERNVQGRA